eukprot:CAMPEP_0182416822 /NCGR_PEP_ID=MMETSP1167-20130531/1193_1 /TAXON_ID=2988 /ORGANISM="Mallomonas Sp, Strain CCMP3275" /LENGTH=175 /DNA_ID=CAMNT_0024589921 /DNA_START=130 /DNA_END=657 /DNA_ORIENTATION=+
MSVTRPSRRKWNFDLKLTQSELSSQNNIRGPPGFDPNFDANHEELSSAVALEKEVAAKNKQVMGLAYSPGKNLMMTGFMLWMSGSSIQIFSIMMTGMALFNPIMAISSLQHTFSKFEGEGVHLTIPKLIYLSFQGLAIGLALYKCSTMGLLPVTSSDWTKLLPPQEYIEKAGVML